MTKAIENEYSFTVKTALGLNGGPNEKALAKNMLLRLLGQVPDDFLEGKLNSNEALRTFVRIATSLKTFTA